MPEIQYNATGRRKNSIAQVFLKLGNGNITVNNKPLNDYFPFETMKMVVQQPLNTVAVNG
jgi:small subunit ribosomal protein S9